MGSCRPVKAELKLQALVWRHPSFKEGAGKRCSECGRNCRWYASRSAPSDSTLTETAEMPQMPLPFISLNQWFHQSRFVSEWLTMALSRPFKDDPRLFPSGDRWSEVPGFVPTRRVTSCLKLLNTASDLPGLAWTSVGVSLVVPQYDSHCLVLHSVQFEKITLSVPLAGVRPPTESA